MATNTRSLQSATNTRSLQSATNTRSLQSATTTNKRDAQTLISRTGQLVFTNSHRTRHEKEGSLKNLDQLFLKIQNQSNDLVKLQLQVKHQQIQWKKVQILLFQNFYIQQLIKLIQNSRKLSSLDSQMYGNHNNNTINNNKSNNYNINSFNNKQLTNPLKLKSLNSKFSQALNTLFQPKNFQKSLNKPPKRKISGLNSKQKRKQVIWNGSGRIRQNKKLNQTDYGIIVKELLVNIRHNRNQIVGILSEIPDFDLILFQQVGKTFPKIPSSQRSTNYRGVSKNGKSYQVFLMLDGKNKAYFGRFSSELDAAIAYDHAAIQFRCIKAKTNFSYTKRQVIKILGSQPSLKLGTQRDDKNFHQQIQQLYPNQFLGICDSSPTIACTTLKTDILSLQLQVSKRSSAAAALVKIQDEQKV